jgi:hypothetical protein
MGNRKLIDFQILPMHGQYQFSGDFPTVQQVLTSIFPLRIAQANSNI